MERQDNRSGDHAVYCVAGIVILCLLTYFASRSAFVLHKIDLPIICLQAKIFSSSFPGNDHDIEYRNIRNILTIVDREVKRRGSYATINTAALKSIVQNVSARTRNTVRMFMCILFVFAGSFMIVATIRVRNRLYGSRENIRGPTKPGVEGFVQIVGKHVTTDMIARVRASPTPECLGEAFGIARESVNIPCSIVGRLFPKNSTERLTLLMYGKTSVVFDPAQREETYREGPKE